MMSRPLTKRIAAEALGTALLVATVVGSGIMATRLTDDMGLALLANTLATGAMLVVLITVLGPLSGAHLNPVMSFVLAVSGRLRTWDAGAYALAQIAGGLAGTLIAHAMFELPLLQTSTTARSGIGQWLSEGIATFGLVLTVLLGSRSKPNHVAALVGLYITAAYWFTASTSFANPAVAIARALTDTFSGIRPVDLLGFIAAQGIGGMLALHVGRWLAEEGVERPPITNSNPSQRIGP